MAAKLLLSQKLVNSLDVIPDPANKRVIEPVKKTCWSHIVENRTLAYITKININIIFAFYAYVITLLEKSLLHIEQGLPPRYQHIISKYALIKNPSKATVRTYLYQKMHFEIPK